MSTQPNETPIHRIYDVQTGEITEIPFSAAELKAWKAATEAAEAEAAAAQAAAAEKQAEKERIAAALGITLDELKVLLS